jgi:ketosteroid isomerase-like protein
MNKLYFACLLAAALSACSEEKKQGTPPPTVNNDSANTAVALKMFAHFNSHNWQAMANMYSDTALFKDPSLGTGIVKQTRQQTVEKYAELNKMFADIKDSVVQVYPSGEKYITVEFISKGTAPDGTVFELPICTVLTIEKGLITKDFTYYDK